MLFIEQIAQLAKICENTSFLSKFLQLTMKVLTYVGIISSTIIDIGGIDMIIKKRDDQSINKILENHRQQLNDLLENEDVSLTDNEIVIKSKILDNYIIEYINSKKSNSK
jgi:hypothetical protein